MRWLLGTAFPLISAPCFAADNIPPVDMGATPPVYGAPIYGGPVYGGPVLPAYRGYGGPVYGGPVLPALPAYRGYGGPMDGVTPIHSDVPSQAHSARFPISTRTHREVLAPWIVQRRRWDPKTSVNRL